MDESICEVVLIGVEGTALQAMYDHPAGATRGALLLHPKGSSRHDRVLRKFHAALEEQGVAVLVPDLVDESEGWHDFGSPAFFARRAEAVLGWWHERASDLPLAVIAPGADEAMARQLLRRDQVRSVVLLDQAGYRLYSRSGEEAVADPLLANLWGESS
jgi:alpha/beta superfamily hydrolase